MSSLYIDEAAAISQEILMIQHNVSVIFEIYRPHLQIYRRFDTGYRRGLQHSTHTTIQKSRAPSTALLYTRTAVPLTATINIPSRTTS